MKIQNGSNKKECLHEALSWKAEGGYWEVAATPWKWKRKGLKRREEMNKHKLSAKRKKTVKG